MLVKADIVMAAESSVPVAPEPEAKTASQYLDLYRAYIKVRCRELTSANSVPLCITASSSWPFVCFHVL